MRIVTKSKIVIYAALTSTLLFLVCLFSLLVLNMTKKSNTDLLEDLYKIESYAAIQTDNYLDQEEEINYIYTKDQGVARFEDENIYEFEFKTQIIYENFLNEWELFLVENESIPGSIEYLTGLNLDDYDTKKLEDMDNNKTCDEVGIVENCRAFSYKADDEQSLEFYFDTEDDDIRFIKVVAQDIGETTYLFERVNDKDINVSALFEDLKPEMEETIKPE